MSSFNRSPGRRIAAPNPDSQTLDRALPTQPAPSSAGPGDVYNLTEPKTFITQAGGIVQIVPAMQVWAKATFILESAGPVEVSSSSSFRFLQGQGIALITDVPISLSIAKGNNLYIQSGGTDRVRFVIEPFPWLEQITRAIQGGLGTLARAVQALALSIRGQ